MSSTARIGFVVAALLGPESAPSGVREETSARYQGHGIVGVVGHWTSINDDGPAIRADGERWSGQTTRKQLEAVRTSLFPTLTESFVSNATAAGAFPLAVVGGVSDFTAGTIRVRFKLLGGRSDQTAGIVLGLQPTGEYLFVRYNTKDGNVALWRYANGERETLARGEAHTQLPLGAWHELVVSVNGTKVTGEVSGRGLTMSHTLERPPAGRVGLWTKRDAVTVFKDVRVSR